MTSLPGKRVLVTGSTQGLGLAVARRLAFSPEGVAALIVSLCSPECRDITGAAIPIDGGWSAM